MESENTLWDQQEIIRILSARPGTAYQESDAENQEIFRRWVRGLLNTEAITVEFVKSDGSLREMLCTLDPDRIDAPVTMTTSIDGRSDRRPRKHPAKAHDHNVQTVFDLDLKQWRSFRYDRLKKITVTIGLDSKVHDHSS